jgi:HAD superfamily hydrolase (TIGR01490 family)
MQKVALFDVDGTLFRSSLFIELTEVLLSLGHFDSNAKKMYAREELLWRNREGTYESYIEKLVVVFMDQIKGVEYSDFERAVEHVLEIHQKRVYTYTRDLVAKLKKKKYYLVAVSQSPKGILEPFCKEYGFDKIYGRFYELGPQDRFTGNIVDQHIIVNKANIVRRVIEKENLTLEGSVAVGDTEGDIPMLELAETPICFNPNAKLYKHAKRNGWKVVVERKDVIYEF